MAKIQKNENTKIPKYQNEMSQTFVTKKKLRSKHMAHLMSGKDNRPDFVSYNLLIEFQRDQGCRLNQFFCDSPRP